MALPELTRRGLCRERPPPRPPAPQAFYLPWTLMAIDMLMGQPIIEDAMGIVAAHLYYFLAVLYPRRALLGDSGAFCAAVGAGARRCC